MFQIVIMCIYNVLVTELEGHLSVIMSEAKIIALRRLEQEVFMARQMKGEFHVVTKKCTWLNNCLFVA